MNEKGWIYKVELLPPVSKAVAEANGTYALSFEGLDTLAIVRLNGKVILTSDNMFLPHHVDITRNLNYDGANTLEVEFASAFQAARKNKAKYPNHKWICWNGDPARLAVRKAQYHWYAEYRQQLKTLANHSIRGWDWGPVLSPCGPWQPISLLSYSGRISDVRIDYGLTADLTAASVTMRAFIETSPSGSKVDFTFQRGISGPIYTLTTVPRDGKAVVETNIRDIKLWWPRGYGEQSLYHVRVALVRDGHVIHEIFLQVGFRKAELIREKDEHEDGESFFFRVNDVDIFCGGSNWIPADSFLPRVSVQKYEQWLQLLAEGNQNMVRVWGGGIYEDETFYVTCDRLGILVWQDFMFACGNYPTHSSFLGSVKEEARANVRRLRHHPSIAVFAGNNEDYQIQESENLTYDPEDTDPESWLKTDFPARYIYEHLLPSVVKEEAPSIAYVPGSPFSKVGLPTTSPTHGDLHQWNVWHGTQSPYQMYPQLAGRFISEFGMESFPCLATIKSFVPNLKTNSQALHPQSEIIDAHNKAAGSTRRLASYVYENFGVGPTLELEDWIYLTQLLQCEALSYAYKSWRRLWGQHSSHRPRKLGGVLVWQLNDCWPCVSWSIVDYHLRPKPAYFAVKRHLAPLAVGVMRECWDWSDGHKVTSGRPRKQKWEAWVANRTLERKNAWVEVRFISIATGEEIKETMLKAVTIAANGVTEPMTGYIDNEIDEPHVLAAKLWVDDGLAARDWDWPQPLKYLDLSERAVSVEERRDGEMCWVSVRAEKPVKGFVFEQRDGVMVNDNGFDVMPGDDMVVEVWGLKGGEKMEWKFLGM